jgi:predicted transcriptional regulator
VVSGKLGWLEIKWYNLTMLIYWVSLSAFPFTVVKGKAEALVVTSKEIGLEVNVNKIKYMVMSRDKNAGRRHSVKSENSSFERVGEFKYLGKNLTYQNSIQEEIKSRLKSGNACYHSVQNLLSSSISKNLRIRIYRIVILPVVLYGCETWSFTLRKERKLKVFQTRLFRGEKR